MDIGKNLKRLLVKKGIKQKELAEMTGLTETTISRYVGGERTPRTSCLILIADALGIDEHALIVSPEKRGWKHIGTPKSSRFECPNCLEIAYYPQPVRKKQDAVCPYRFCPYCGMHIEE